MVQVYMASASILRHITLNDSEVLLASGEDLKDYFYQFKVNFERTCRNVLSVNLMWLRLSMSSADPLQG